MCVFETYGYRLNCVLPNSFVEVLTPNALGYDLIWK